MSKSEVRRLWMAAEDRVNYWIERTEAAQTERESAFAQAQMTACGQVAQALFEKLMRLESKAA